MSWLPGCWTRRWSGARQEGHATRQGILHAMHAACALAQGSLHDAQVEAETGLLLVEHPHFIAQLLVAVAMTVQIERGALDAAAALAANRRSDGNHRGPHLRPRVPDRARAAADSPGSARGGCRGPPVVQPAARGAGGAMAKHLEGLRGSRACRTGRPTAGCEARPRAVGGGPAGRRARRVGHVTAYRGPGDRRGRRAGAAPRGGRGPRAQFRPARAGSCAHRSRGRTEPLRPANRRAGTPSAGPSTWPASAVPSRWRKARWPGCTPGPDAAPGSS